MRAAFLDRDGTINRKPPPGDYVTSWDEFEFLSGAIDGIKLLNAAGLLVVVVTNQRGIALRRYSEDDLQDIHGRMRKAIEAQGAWVDAIYHCPHDVGECDCRKPATDLFVQAKLDWPQLEFRESVVIGDSLSDMEAGTRIGCKTILISADRGDSPSGEVPVARVAFSLREAAEWFVGGLDEGEPSLAGGLGQ
jgi:D-glycero-D-manno-heptose 1,7-bisphosphate phosphatase